MFKSMTPQWWESSSKRRTLLLNTAMTKELVENNRRNWMDVQSSILVRAVWTRWPPSSFWALPSREQGQTQNPTSQKKTNKQKTADVLQSVLKSNSNRVCVQKSAKRQFLNACLAYSFHSGQLLPDTSACKSGENLLNLVPVFSVFTALL